MLAPGCWSVLYEGSTGWMVFIQGAKGDWSYVQTSLLKANIQWPGQSI